MIRNLFLCRAAPRLSRRVVLLSALATTMGAQARVHAAPTVRRIVTLDGSLLETVCLLGGAARMVGADVRDRFPRSMEKLPSVGDPHAISVEGVLSLSPDVVLRTSGRGPDDRIRTIEAAGIRVVTLPADYTLDNVLLKVDTIARLLGEQELGARYAERISSNRARLQRASSSRQRTPSVAFVLDVDARSLLVAGHGTPAEAMILLAGGDLVPDGLNKFARIATEAFIGSRPEYVLMGDHTVRRLGGPAAVVKLPPFAMAGLRREQLITIESVSLLGFGPRATHALAQLMAAIHPRLAMPPLDPIEIPE